MDNNIKMKAFVCLSDGSKKGIFCNFITIIVYMVYFKYVYIYIILFIVILWGFDLDSHPRATSHQNNVLYLLLSINGFFDSNSASLGR